jgi:hypothetical protein
MFEGVIRVHKENAYVTVAELDVDVLVEGRKMRNRTFDSDAVVVEITPDVSKWRLIVKKGERAVATLLDGDDDDDDDNDVDGDEEILLDSGASSATPSAESTPSKSRSASALALDASDVTVRLAAVTLAADEDRRAQRINVINDAVRDLKRQPCGEVVRIRGECLRCARAGHS